MTKTQSKPNPNDFDGFLIWQVANKWEKFLNSALKEFYLNQGECFHLITLWQLLESNKEVTQTILVNQCGMTPMNTSKVITSLLKKNLITKVVGSDIRSNSIQFTDSGRNLAISLAPILLELHKGFFGSETNSNFINSLQIINSK